MRQSLKSCIMGQLGGCIDPCDDCPNMKAVKFVEGEPDEKIIRYQTGKISPEALKELREMLRIQPVPETLCQIEQGSKECYKVVCPVCTQFKPKGTKEESAAFRKKYIEQFS